jgi:hypothetical protein
MLPKVILRDCAKSKEKDPVVPKSHYAPRHEETCGRRYRAPSIPNLSIRRGRVISLKPRPLYPTRRGFRYSLDRRLFGHQNRSGHSEKSKNMLPWRESNPESLVAFSVVSISTALSRLQFHGSTAKPVWGRGLSVRTDMFIPFTFSHYVITSSLERLERVLTVASLMRRMNFTWVVHVPETWEQKNV